MALGRLIRVVTLATAVVLGVAACSSSSPKANTQSHTAKAGGVYRVGVSSLGVTDSLDPTGEYSIPGWALLEPMLRTLVTYRLAPGAAGLQIVPDLAASLPTISANQLTYTFHLRSNVHFGPPVNRVITSSDVAYAFERMDVPSLAATYPFYYQDVIAGMAPTKGHQPQPISGIQTPNPTTIIFHLTRRTGDFLERLTLPATAPIPSQVAHCFTAAGGYGRDLVSSGPYMIQGAQNLATSSCSAMKPLTGFDPEKGILLVRNPNYSASTDPATNRHNYANAIDVTVDSNTTDIFSKVQAGQLDSSWTDPPPPVVLRQYVTNPSLKSRLFVNAFSGENLFLTMNLTVPPFDDVHVRKAVNYILDKAEIQQTWGGPISGQIATHFVPPWLFHYQLTASYDPYATPGHHGSLTLAEAQMKLSKYDPKHDGKCDVAACRNLVMVNFNTPPYSTYEAIVVQDLAKIGIQVLAREFDVGSAYEDAGTVSNRVPLFMSQQGDYDYPDPYTFYRGIYSSGSIIPSGGLNVSLVGLTPAQATQLRVPYPSGGVLSIDSRLATCEPLSGPARLQCEIGVEKYLTEQVVPSVPYLWLNQLTVLSSDVTHFEADPFSGTTSFTQVAVSNHLPVPAPPG